MSTTAVLQDAAAFVSRAERMTNERDVDGIREVFAADAHWTTVLDGTVLESHGIDAIHRDWGLLCAVMESRRMIVTKTLVLADAATIVNEWVGTVSGKEAARGIEVWVRDGQGRVVDQRLYGFSDARSDASLVQNLRMLVAHPFTAAAFVRARFGSRFGGRP